MSSKILYDYGTDNTSVTGGFAFKGNYVSQATVLKDTDCMYMKNGNFGSYNFLMCETTNPVNLTDYTELKAELTCPTSNPSDYSRFGIGKEPITNNYGGVELVSDPIGKIGNKQIVTLDISNIDGFYYINLMADNGNEMIIHKVWLDGGSDIPDTPSRLAGTDAVAIAYAIARNQESAAALQEIKKAYREGLIEGDNGSGEVIEPYETTDPVIDIPTGEDDKITEPACIDLTRGGLWLKYQNPEDETDIRTVKIYLTEDTVGVNGGYNSFYGNHYIAVDIFDKDNQLIKTLYMLGNDGNKQWYYEKAMTYDKLYYITITDKIHVYASGFVNRDYSMYFYNPSGENHYYYKHDINFSPYISGYTYISCGNIKPE